VLLLHVATALLREPGRSPFQDAVKACLRDHAVDASRVEAAMEALVHECLRGAGSARRRPGRGTPDEAARVLQDWRESRVHDASVPYPVPRGGSPITVRERPRTGSARGKYAYVPTGSDAFAGRKRGEIAIEDEDGR
jgi:hypothetical protein